MYQVIDINKIKIHFTFFKLSTFAIFFTMSEQFRTLIKCRCGVDQILYNKLTKGALGTQAELKIPVSNIKSFYMSNSMLTIVYTTCSQRMAIEKVLTRDGVLSNYDYLYKCHVGIVLVKSGQPSFPLFGNARDRNVRIWILRQ